jgi:transposase-like protein
MTRHSPYVIKLSAADRAVLEKRSRSYTARHADVIRAKIVLLCADGQQNTAIAARLDVHVNAVRMWRKRYYESGLDGLADRPRSRRPRSLPAGASPATTAMGGRPVEREPRPARWSSTELAAQAVTEDLVAILGPDRAGGRRPGRRSGRPGPTAAAPAGKLLAFPSRHPSTATLDALRHLVSSINRYLDEVDAEHVRAGQGGARRGPGR